MAELLHPNLPDPEDRALANLRRAHTRLADLCETVAAKPSPATIDLWPMRAALSEVRDAEIEWARIRANLAAKGEC